MGATFIPYPAPKFENKRTVQLADDALLQADSPKEVKIACELSPSTCARAVKFEYAAASLGR
jgi:hypothetical protein